MTPKNNYGFTFLELMIVMTLISIFLVITVPKASRALRSDSTNEKLLGEIFEKAASDAKTSSRTEFFTVHLAKDDNSTGEFSSRANGISILILNDDGTIVETSNRFLRFRQFSGSYSIERVITGKGVTFDNGEVMIPLYPDGKNEDAVLVFQSDNGYKYFKINSLSGKLVEENEDVTSVYSVK